MFGIDDAIIGAAVGGMFDVGSQLLGGFMGNKGAEKSNAMQYSMFKEQMDFQERMFKNRHQYEVADLRAAGLNPILSANSAASAPMGASPIAMQNPNAPMAGAMSSSAKSFNDVMQNIMKGVQRKGQAEANTSSYESKFNAAVLEDRIKAEKAKLKADMYMSNSASDWFGRTTRRIGQTMGNLGKFFGGGNTK